MKATVATAGMLSAAVLLAPGCGSGSQPQQIQSSDPVRRATFRALAARHFLASCPASGSRRETAFQAARLEELKALATRKGAGQAVWLGENDWGGVARYSDRRPCAAGPQAYRRALAAFSGTLDALAAGIADHPQ